MGMTGEKYVDVEGVRTRYFEAGQGEPMLLVHGGHFGSRDNVDLADNWDLNFAELARSYHVYAIDKLGQGYTDNPSSDADYTMSAVVNHAYGFLRALDINRVSLVGHSRGGFLVTRLTHEHQEMVKALVIVDSGTTAPGEVARGTLLSNPPQPLLSKESLRWITRQFSSTDEHVTDEWLDVRAEVGQTPKYQQAISRMAALNESQFLPRLAEQKEETLTWIRDGKLQVPTLVIWGRNDPSALLQNGIDLYHLIAESTDRSQMHIFNRAGHYAYREHPRDFSEVVRAFVQLS